MHRTVTGPDGLPRRATDTAGAAVYIGRPPATMVNWRSLGIGPRFIKQGRSVVYLYDALDTWLDQQRHCTAPDTGATDDQEVGGFTHVGDAIDEVLSELENEHGSRGER